MKESLHPVYREVIFKDMATGDTFLSRSAVEARDTIQWDDGKEYPLVKLEISSYSHPFFTGQERMLDAEGRVERFMKKYKKK